MFHLSWKWFEILGEFEALSSLALLSYDHPDLACQCQTLQELYRNQYGLQYLENGVEFWFELAKA